MFDRQDFAWKGLALHHGRRKTPVLTLVADATYPHLFRIQYPDGWTSAAANRTRAKDAAYGHGRYLLGGQSRVERPQAGGTKRAARLAPRDSIRDSLARIDNAACSKSRA